MDESPRLIEQVAASAEFIAAPGATALPDARRFRFPTCEFHWENLSMSFSTSANFGCAIFRCAGVM